MTGEQKDIIAIDFSWDYLKIAAARVSRLKREIIDVFALISVTQKALRLTGLRGLGLEKKRWKNPYCKFPKIY